MAPNKKQKQSFTEALKAKAESMANPRREFIEFKYGDEGEYTRTYRGDMTDEEWEKLKKSASAKTGVTQVIVGTEGPKTEPKPGAKDLEDLELIETKPEVVEKEQEEAEKPKFKDGETTADAARSDIDLSAATAPLPKAKNPTQEEYDAKMAREARSKQAKKEAEEAKPSALSGALEQAKLLGEAGRDTAIDLVTGRPIIRAIAKGVDQAIGGGPIIDPEVAQTLGTVPGMVAGAGGMQTGTGLQGLGAVLGMPNVTAKGEQLYRTGAEQLGRSVGQFNEPESAGPDIAVGPLTRVPDPALAEPSAAPPVAAPMSGPGAGMGISAKSTTARSSSAPMVPSVDQYRKASDAARENAIADIENAKETEAAMGFARMALHRQERDQELKVRGDAEKMAGLAAQARLNGIAEAKRFQTAQLQTLEEARKAAATPTDPNRFWSNKNAGQQAAAVIAGALFGFTGKGMEWLQRIDGLIESDMRAQQTDRAALVAGMEKQAAGLGVAGQQAMQFGATEAEAHLIERDAKLEGLKSFLDMTARTSKNMDMTLRAAQMSADLSQKQAELRMQAQAMNEAEVHRKNDDMFKRARLGIEREELAFKIAQSQAPSGGRLEPVRGPQAMELGALQAAQKTAKELQEKFGDKNIISRMLDKGSAMFPGTSATNYNVARDQAINMIAPMMGAGVLQAHDLERWEKLMAKSGDLNGEEMLRVLVNDISRLYNEKREALARTGHDVASLPILQSSSGIKFTPTE